MLAKLNVKCPELKLVILWGKNFSSIENIFPYTKLTFFTTGHCLLWKLHFFNKEHMKNKFQVAVGIAFSDIIITLGKVIEILIFNHNEAVK